MNILQAHHLTKKFANHVALNDVSIDIPSEKIIGLLGPNGAGKTTFIRIITQIFFPDNGTVFFKNEKLNTNHISKIGYMPEERGLYKKMRVGEQLIYLAQLKGLSYSIALEKVRYWLEKLNMTEWWNKKLEELSKGMQQKVQFIATILHDPELIILDEPFSGFDPINANLIKEEILQLKQKGKTIIFSTHRMESVEELCDYMVLINKSKKILEGKVHEIKSSYTTNTYILETEKSIDLSSEPFLQLISSQPLLTNRIETIIQLTNTISTNELIEKILNQTTLYRFEEKKSSIQDIFIRKVNEEK